MLGWVLTNFRHLLRQDPPKVDYVQKVEESLVSPYDDDECPPNSRIRFLTGSFGQRGVTTPSVVGVTGDKNLGIVRDS